MVKTKEEIVVLGDVEIGGGTFTDDFISDVALSRLILKLAKRKHPVHLVFNGDTFDFLKCPYIKRGKTYYPRHITEEVSLAKLGLIHEAHALVFDALRKFVEEEKNRVIFVLGNHDLDIAFKKVQTKLKKILKSSKRVQFPGLVYRRPSGVYITHGHKYDPINWTEKVFRRYRGKQTLNLPWFVFGQIARMMRVKEEHPFLERILPRETLFAHTEYLRKKITRISIGHLFKSIIKTAFMRRHGPHSLPWHLLPEFYRRWRQAHWDIAGVIDIFKQTEKKQTEQNKVCVLGHIHETYIERKNGQVITHPGSWRDEYDLDEESGELIPRKKMYVQILDTGRELKTALRHFPIRRKPLEFCDVRENEHEYIRKVAEDEGYVLPERKKRKSLTEWIKHGRRKLKQIKRKGKRRLLAS